MSEKDKNKQGLGALKVKDDALDDVSGGVRICGREYNQETIDDKQLRKGPVEVKIKV